MLPIILITLFSLSFSVLLIQYFENKDVIKYLSKHGCECYLTGKSIYENQTNNIDIYVKFSEEKELFDILKQYGDVKIVSINYNEKMYDLFLITINNIKYEFRSYLLDGCVLDKKGVLIEYLHEIPVKQQKMISNLSWNCNIDQDLYLHNIENIFRCFKDSSYYNLNLEYSTIEYIKKSLQEQKKYRFQIIFDELYKILTTENSHKYIEIMLNINLFQYIDIEFNNSEHLIEILKNNKYAYENPVFFLCAIKTENLMKFMINKKITQSKFMSKCIRYYSIILNEFYNKFLNIKNGYDCIKLLQSIKLKFKFLSYDNLHEILELFDNYKNLNNQIIDFNYMEYLEKTVFDDMYFPLTIEELQIDKNLLITEYNVTKLNLHVLREAILDEIHNEKLINGYDYIVEFLEKDKKK